MKIVKETLGFVSAHVRDKFISDNPDLFRCCRICHENIPLDRMTKVRLDNGKFYIGFRCNKCRAQKKVIGCSSPASIPHKFNSLEAREIWAKRSQKLYKCKKCGEMKRATLFKRHTQVRTYGRIFDFDSDCRACATKIVLNKTRDFTSTLEGALKFRVRVLRGRNKGKPFDLTPDFMLSLWNKQNGCCYYSGRPMTWNSLGNGRCEKTDFSVDRIDPSNGYIQDNVVLCSNHVNTMKSDLSRTEFFGLVSDIARVANENRN